MTIRSRPSVSKPIEFGDHIDGEAVAKLVSPARFWEFVEELFESVVFESLCGLGELFEKPNIVEKMSNT